MATHQKHARKVSFHTFIVRVVPQVHLESFIVRVASIGVLGCSTIAGCGALSPLVRCSMPLSSRAPRPHGDEHLPKEQRRGKWFRLLRGPTLTRPICSWIAAHAPPRRRLPSASVRPSLSCSLSSGVLCRSCKSSWWRGTRD